MIRTYFASATEVELGSVINLFVLNSSSRRGAREDIRMRPCTGQEPVRQYMRPTLRGYKNPAHGAEGTGFPLPMYLRMNLSICSLLDCPSAKSVAMRWRQQLRLTQKCVHYGTVYESKEIVAQRGISATTEDVHLCSSTSQKREPACTCSRMCGIGVPTASPRPASAPAMALSILSSSRALARS